MFQIQQFFSDSDASEKRKHKDNNKIFTSCSDLYLIYVPRFTYCIFYIFTITIQTSNT